MIRNCRKNTTLSAYLALKWSTLIVKHAMSKDSAVDELPKLIEAQANLCTSAIAAADKKLNDKVYSLLSRLWKAPGNTHQKYIEILCKLEASNGVIVLASLLTKFLVSNDKANLIDTYKAKTTNLKK